MKSQRSITKKTYSAKKERFSLPSYPLKPTGVWLRRPLMACFLALILSGTVVASVRIAIIVPEKSSQARKVADSLEAGLSDRFRIVDRSLAEAIFQSRSFERPFNLSTDESRQLGAIIGCNFFILVRSNTLRRTSFEKEKYWESHAAKYLVITRTGRLAWWRITKFEEDSETLAIRKLFEAVAETGRELAVRIVDTIDKEIAEEDLKIEELPEAKDIRSEGLRPPLPYRRIKPNYTQLAGLYDVVATVDIAVDIDKNGEVIRTEITRWAGYGLDESVRKTVLEMNWRPADRNGKTLPMRVLLRYNFKNIDSE